MSTGVRKLLDSFQALPEVDKHQAAVEILRLTTKDAHDALSDAALVEAADELFRGLDEEEARNAAS